MGSLCFSDKNQEILKISPEKWMPRFRWTKNSKFELFKILSGFIIPAILMSPPSAIAIVGAKFICDKIPELTPLQRDLCYENPSLIIAADEGSNLGLEECYRQFKRERWNCYQDAPPVFGEDQKLGTKEAAYDSAIRSAGVLHAVATACGEGHLRECGCDRSKRGYFEWTDTHWNEISRADRRRSVTQAWMWGGCSVDIKRALRYSRDIWDAREITATERAAMNMHNYEAGRRAVVKRLKVQCKCHGVSASCTTNTCWITLPDFREVGSALKRSYHKSRKVLNSGINPRYPRLIYWKDALPMKPHKKELIHLETSPSYCEYNVTSETEGTEERICRTNTSESDNCNDLCCGRGFETREKDLTFDCKCKFYWCCHVQCKKCREVVKEHFCL